MRLLRLKTFAAKSGFIRDYLPIASVGLSGAGVYLSASRNNQLKEQNAAQLQAMKDLTRSLGKVDESLEKSSALIPSKKKQSRPNNGFNLW